MSENNQNKFGYKPSFSITIIRFLVSFLQKILFLNKDNIFSNEFAQSLSLKKTINFDGKKIIFRTGHGRLRWRAVSFFEEEPLMIEWIRSFSKQDIFLDIGANVGIYTLAALTKNCKVYSVELDPKNVSILFDNLYLNKFFDNCLVLPFAIGDTNKIEKIYYRDFSIGDALQSIGKETQLPTIMGKKFFANQIVFNLDHIFNQFSLEYPTKVKIDVDGNEKIVMEGAKDLISNCNEIYIEDNGLEDDNYIINFLNTNNFTEYKKMPINKDMKNIKIYNRLFRKNKN